MNQLELATAARADKKTRNVVEFYTKSLLEHLTRVSKNVANSSEVATPIGTKQAAVMELVAEELLKHNVSN